MDIFGMEGMQKCVARRSRGRGRMWIGESRKLQAHRRAAAPRIKPTSTAPGVDKPGSSAIKPTRRLKRVNPPFWRHTLLHALPLEKVGAFARYYACPVNSSDKI